MTEFRALRLSPDDDVAVVPDAAPQGSRLDLGGGQILQARGDIPAGHKVSVRDISAGELVKKYGNVIGVATTSIASGEHVHTHNLGFTPSEAKPGDSASASKTPAIQTTSRSFQGYRRADGRVGTRNFIGILTTVNCSATAAKLAARRVTDSGILLDQPDIDGVVALTHTTGCCIDGYGLELLQRTLRGYMQHPNFGGVVVVGLGCEVNQVDELLSGVDQIPDRPTVNLQIQDVGGTAATVDMISEAIEAMIPEVGAHRREEATLEDLVVAMECGGSDAYSGLTANPAVGHAGDLIAAAGGTFVFGETPEIYGAEHLLMARASDDAVAENLRSRISWWEQYVAMNGTTINNNPTPGNKEGGITTILEKSLGAVAKGGTSTLADVVEYAQPITAKGLVFMDTPGYDPVSVTGMVAGGANVVCFTTGRGSVFGCKPVPSIKIATNTAMYQRLEGDMDVNAGPIFDGESTVEQTGAEILDLILDVASGKRTKSELLGLGDEEFTPWQIGAVV